MSPRTWRPPPLRRLLPLLLVGSLAAAPALASEYPLTGLPFLTEAEVAALRKLPASTTHEAGRALASPSQRRKARSRTHLAAARLVELASLFDLMRVRGVGSRMALLIRAAGVSSCAELARRDPDALAKALAETNKRAKIANKLPNAEILGSWIAQARKLPRQFQAKK